MRKAFAGLAVVMAAVLVLVIGAGAAITPRTVTPTNMAITGHVDALVLNGGRLFVGGQMTETDTNPSPFTRLGALDPSTGAVVWKASGVTSEVRALAAINGALYAGGDFGLRVYDLSSLNLLGTIACGSVRAIEASVDGLSAVVGGGFTTCGGQTHKNLALVTGTTVVSTWMANTNGTVKALATDTGGTFVGGEFVSINGTSRFKLGKVTPTGGLDDWNSTYVPNSGDVGSAKSVRALDFAAGRLFASWGESVNKTVVYDQASSVFMRYWVTDGDTQAILTDCGNVYLGGHWYQYAGPNSSSLSVHFAAFDATSFTKEAVVTPIPRSPMGVFTIISDGSAGLWLGGDVVGDWGTPATKVKRLVHLTMPASQCGAPSSGTTTTTTTTTVAGGSTTSTTTTTTTVPPTTTTTTPGGPDTQEPDSKVTAPVAKATISTPYTFVGTATDNVAVSRVRVAIRNATTQLWLQANGTWSTTFYQADVITLVQNGTTWNWTWKGPAIPAGSYFFQSKATDPSGNNETSTPWVAFTA